MNIYTTHYGGYDFECDAENQLDAQNQALSHFRKVKEFARINLSLADMRPVKLLELRQVDPVVESPIFR